MKEPPVTAEDYNRNRFRKLSEEEWAFYSQFKGIICGKPKPVQKTLISEEGFSPLNDSSTTAD